MIVNKNMPVIAWWSGGIRSAVVCKLCIDWYGKENVRVVFIDTKNEHKDTYRFKKDCEKWYDTLIETITNKDYDNIEDIWFESMSLGLAKGAKCSQILKIKVRQDFTKRNKFSFQAFGYDSGETGRANDMKNSNPHLRPIFPLLMVWLNKFDCVKFIQAANNMFLSIELPIPYLLGLENNNCYETGCIQGGIGYWQWMQINEPEKFIKMAKREHDITDLKGSPVTVLKDQSNKAKENNNGKGQLIFLIHNPKYPQVKDISMMKGRPPEMLIECNGFCSLPIQSN